MAGNSDRHRTSPAKIIGNPDFPSVIHHNLTADMETQPSPLLPGGKEWVEDPGEGLLRYPNSGIPNKEQSHILFLQVFNAYTDLSARRCYFHSIFENIHHNLVKLFPVEIDRWET